MPRIAMAIAATALCCAGFATASAQKPTLDCHVGPVKKTYGATPWLAYSCSDGKTVIFVTDEGSPATPFVFIMTPKDGSLSLSGEGTGEKRLTDAAFEELKTMRSDDINKLILETKTKAG